MSEVKIDERCPYSLRRMASTLSVIHKLIGRRMPPCRVLDIGCGPGWILSGIGHPHEKMGIDRLPPWPEFSGRYIQRDVVRDGLPSFIPKFDIIIITEMLEHLTREEGRLLLEDAKSNLSPQGQLVLSVPNNRKMSDDEQQSFSCCEVLREYVGVDLVQCECDPRWLLAYSGVMI